MKHATNTIMQTGAVSGGGQHDQRAQSTNPLARRRHMPALTEVRQEIKGEHNAVVNVLPFLDQQLRHHLAW